LYPPLIKWIKKKGWIGYDIHKKARTPTPESGGIGITIALVFGSIIVGIFYPELWMTVLVFIITIVFAGAIGFIDDRKQFSSIKKIILLIIAGLPVFIFNLPFIGWISVNSPKLPVLGQLRLNVIYPLILPFIVLILTNTVNMLEGYNGEGSGTTSIATFFIIIAAIMTQSGEGVIFGVVILGAGLGFYKFNKFPAKVFPGDVGTLTIGSAIAMLGILGSLEIAMVLVMLPQIFNSFYVIASVHGFKESHTVEIKDISMDDEDYIHASLENGAPLTLPRLILATGKLNEKDLVRNIMALSVISGIFAIMTIQWILPIDVPNYALSFSVFAIGGILYVIVIKKFPRIFGITIIMTILMIIALILVYILDIFIVKQPLNWLYSGILGIIVLIIWYGITIVYFKRSIKEIINKIQN
jgi:UDP-N-acetylglucosamine--dolichyl-phosphate N-acetylglucosaminephosphotransferase